MLKEHQLTQKQFKSLEGKKPAKGALSVTSGLSLTRLSLLDSIDGRALESGLALIWQPTAGRAGLLSVRDTVTGERRVLLPLKAQPETPSDLPSGLLAGAVHKALDGRALVPLVQWKAQCLSADVTVKGQTIADVLAVSPGEEAKPWMWVDVRRGFEAQVKSALSGYGSTNGEAGVFQQLMAEGQKSAQLNGKGFPKLDAKAPSRDAIQILHQTLIAQLTSQIDGTCKDLDIEFLHDLRVASRRARSLLQTVKTVLSEDVQTHGIERYKWIGQRTTNLRDLDVYLHDYPALQAALSPEMRTALEPFRTALQTERKRAFKQVKTLLTSKAFEDFVASWNATLEMPDSYQGKDADTLIEKIAAQAIWKRYRRICNDGNAITDASPAEDLHDLRKQGKKLRYLLEFFASLYPDKQIKPRISSLKKLQDLLGSYQDCAVQAEFLEDKAAKLRKNVSVPADTLMAMGALADQRLQDEKRLRTEFQAFFTPFASQSERDGYKAMLGL